MAPAKSTEAWTADEIDSMFKAVETLHIAFLERRDLDKTASDRADETLPASAAEDLTKQLTNGCGSSKCTNVYCYTGRHNTSTAPLRRHTLRSSRTIAFGMLFAPAKKWTMCQAPQTISQASSENDKRDPTSLTQIMSDSKTMQRFLDSHDFSARSYTCDGTQQRLEHLRTMLEMIKQPPYTRDGIKNIKHLANRPAALQMLTVIFYVLYHFAVLDVPEDVYKGLLSLARNHDGQPAITDTGMNQGDKALMKLAHLLQYTKSMDIVTDICQVIAYRWSLDKVMVKIASREKSFYYLLKMGLTRAVHRDIHVCEKDPLFATFTQLVALFLYKEWDGGCTFERQSVTHVAFELLDHFDSCYEYQPRVALTDLMLQQDTTKVVESWLSNRHDAHILDYHRFHESSQLRDYFFMINHIKMRHTHATQSVLDGLQHEFLYNVSAPLSFQARGRLGELQQTFLALRVRRSHVLKDALDQLWHIHTGELFKPLRVRIVEMDGQAIGQDLGGVQIEFFNLLMKAILIEEAGLFVSKDNGYVYPRPGSLQPLHIFEGIGLLLGLALYNGIPLPINFPRAFYALLSCTWHEDVPPMEDAWPVQDNSLHKMEGEDITGWGLTYDFNLEANGVRLAFSKAACEAFSTASKPVPVISATSIDDVASSIVPEDIKWPGWSFVQDESDEELVDEANKVDFIEHSTRWYTYWSVRPQMDALTRGFFRILRPEALQLISIQDHLEGSERLDLESIRKNTSYDGFDNEDVYINDFWRILNSWPEQRQRALIKFVTASERFPSLNTLAWKISCAQEGVDDQRLPTSSTCFATLYLPRYSSAEIMDEKLTKAVEYGDSGFFVG